MTEKRTYTAVVASLETNMIFIKEHLHNIDTHLEKLNDKEALQNVAITKNKMNIRWIIRIGGSIMLLVLGLLAIAAGLVRIF